MFDILHALMGGFGHVFGAHTLMLMVVGVGVGVVAGALPGISFVNAMALALPFTYLLQPEQAMVFLTGIYVGGVFGGSISAILINIPGTPASLPSCWDGYPMTRKGQAARALGIAIMCSAVGGFISALLMIFLSPPFAKIALTFDQPEFFAATALGLISVVAMAKPGQMLVTMTMMFVGLIVGTVGLDPFYGEARLTFGTAILENGISFVVVLVGMFAIGEVLSALETPQSTQHIGDKDQRAKLPSVREIWALKGTMARASGLGCLIGIIPGAGALIGAVLSYAVERTVSKRGAEFGTGVEEGLAAPETAKNATTGAATIPMLTLGIPGSAATAVMMAALMLHGVQPGPLLFVSSTDLVYTVFAGYLVANAFMIVAGLLVARGFASLMKIPAAILFGTIVVLCVIGAFGVRNNWADVYICVAFGFIGYFAHRFGVPSTPMILGVILGPLAERFFFASLETYERDYWIFFTRPYSATIMGLSALFLAWSLRPHLKRLFHRDGAGRDGSTAVARS